MFSQNPLIQSFSLPRVGDGRWVAMVASMDGVARLLIGVSEMCVDNYQYDLIDTISASILIHRYRSDSFHRHYLLASRVEHSNYPSNI
jgi:hypothetical protein